MAAPAASSASAGAKRAHSAAAAERRVQPRHFHFGPNPAAIGDDGGADSQAAAAAASHPPAVCLYRDAVGCVFAFLRQGELAAALQVSRGWLAAANSMRSLQLDIWPGEVPVFVLAQSAMGRHVASVHRYTALSADSLYVLALKMPQLRELDFTLSLPPAPAPLLFPAALRKLDLRVPVLELGRPADLNAALQSVGRLPKLEQLTICLQSLNPQVSFAQLAALPRLCVFSVSLRRPNRTGQLTDVQTDELRTMPRLHQLSLSFMTTNTLRKLLRQPHHLRWQQISLPIPLDDESAALLPQLPSLTRIDCQAACSRFDWLRGLPNLTDVRLSFTGAAADGRAESAVAALQHCTNIEGLSLCNHLTAVHLTELLPRLPRLRELTLSGLDIDSLAFLAQPAMTIQLVSLEVTGCRLLPLAELRHVHSLRGLEDLYLDGSFNELMDSHSRSLYKPPSVLMPQLLLFDYAPPTNIQAQHADDGGEDDDGGDE